jgi:hypothetical protein
MKLFEADFRYEVRNEPTDDLANIFIEELTDRELYEFTLKIIDKMDSTYVHQILEKIGGM